jgi:predicted ester cyclase
VTPGELARRFTVDWLDRADPAVPVEIMTPDYLVHIGGIELVGRDDYAAATLAQLRQFPGLLLTVHDLITDGDRFAIRFSEHGSSARHEGRLAAWRGVALFRTSTGRLCENWTQEDYYSRRRQLADGTVDVIDPPAAAPWSTVAADGDSGALEVVTAWLAKPYPAGITTDDGSPLVIDVRTVEVHEAFAAGDRVAFAATWTGGYLGGLDTIPVPSGGDDVRLGVAGLVTVRDGQVVAGAVVTDRLGLRRTLLGG